MSSVAVVSGSCLCKAVKLTFTEGLKNPPGLIYCHCIQCQKFTGVYGALNPFDWSTLNIEGEENLSWFQEEGKLPMRGFCKKCGSSLLQRREDGTHALVFGGAIDTKDVFKPSTLHVNKEEAGQHYMLD
mmetsp:Transcript_48367/g.121759  ORF Transcript_48367/g.121759 Transcript_48367/m.121759 type:complete len:129 (+) Transcript_48367:78-464(+)|eukprot:CAMPEP_0177653104 /NCGR_PEP_ID=MMETSP0447-20121125/13531_1 /TAXON_ID=0 /ORGANISM="Stygamoeba regulata, Strain BSH-02190019" /LENGTH=128 /DNA_ID=CAMNT_0019156485 /DNA_START=78 /DNA_END=464 /DNA_ORIENTATION=-